MRRFYQISFSFATFGHTIYRSNVKFCQKKKKKKATSYRCQNILVRPQLEVLGQMDEVTHKCARNASLFSMKYWIGGKFQSANLSPTFLYNWSHKGGQCLTIALQCFSLQRHPYDAPFQIMFASRVLEAQNLNVVQTYSSVPFRASVCHLFAKDKILYPNAKLYQEISASQNYFKLHIHQTYTVKGKHLGPL